MALKLKAVFAWINHRPWAVALIIVTLVVTPGFYRLEQINDVAIEAQVQTCENANESRAAQLILWTFVAGLGSDDPNAEPPTPAEQAALNQILAWLGDLFAQRDCSDLNRVYEIPPPPVFPSSDQP